GETIMAVADDSDGNFGRVAKDGVCILEIEMTDDDDEVGAAFHFSGDVVDGFNNGPDMKGADLFGLCVVPCEVAHDEADDGDAKASDVLDDVSFAGEESLAVVLDVSSEKREMGQAPKALNRFPAIVEFMIADGSGVKAEQVSQFVERGAVIDGGDGRALYEIAGIEVKAGGAACTLVAHFGGQISEPAEAVVCRLELGMKVVAVEDGERANVVLCLEKSGQGQSGDKKAFHSRQHTGCTNYRKCSLNAVNTGLRRHPGYNRLQCRELLFFQQVRRRSEERRVGKEC